MGKHLDNEPPGRNLVRMKAISELAKDALELPPVQRLTLARVPPVSTKCLPGWIGDFTNIN